MAEHCLRLLALPCGPCGGPARPDDQLQENMGGRDGAEGAPLPESSIPFVLVIILCLTITPLGNCFVIPQLQESQSQNKHHLGLDGDG